MTPDSFPGHPEFNALPQQARHTAQRRPLSLPTYKPLSLPIEGAYTHTIRRFLDFHGRRPPQAPGAAEDRASLTHLPTRNTAATISRAIDQGHRHRPVCPCRV